MPYMDCEYQDGNPHAKHLPCRSHGCEYARRDAIKPLFDGTHGGIYIGGLKKGNAYPEKNQCHDDELQRRVSAQKNEQEKSQNIQCHPHRGNNSWFNSVRKSPRERRTNRLRDRLKHQDQTRTLGVKRFLYIAGRGSRRRLPHRLRYN